MFWINSMAANIFLRFSASLPSSSDTSGFLRYFLYSQVLWYYVWYDKAFISWMQNFVKMNKSRYCFIIIYCCLLGLPTTHLPDCLHCWQVRRLLSDPPQDGPRSLLPWGHVESAITQVHSFPSINQYHADTFQLMDCIFYKLRIYLLPQYLDSDWTFQCYPFSANYLSPGKNNLHFNHKSINKQSSWVLIPVNLKVSHWRTTAQILDDQNYNNKLHFGIVIKLFLITGNPNTLGKDKQ